VNNWQLNGHSQNICFGPLAYQPIDVKTFLTFFYSRHILQFCFYDVLNLKINVEKMKHNTYIIKQQIEMTFSFCYAIRLINGRGLLT